MHLWSFWNDLVNLIKNITWSYHILWFQLIRSWLLLNNDLRIIIWLNQIFLLNLMWKSFWYFWVFNIFVLFILDIIFVCTQSWIDILFIWHWNLAIDLLHFSFFDSILFHFLNLGILLAHECTSQCAVFLLIFGFVLMIKVRCFRNFFVDFLLSIISHRSVICWSVKNNRFVICVSSEKITLIRFILWWIPIEIHCCCTWSIFLFLIILSFCIVEKIWRPCKILGTLSPWPIHPRSLSFLTCGFSLLGL